MEIDSSQITVSGKNVFIKGVSRGGIVVFGQEWCPHCQENKPIFKEAWVLTNDIHPKGLLYLEGTRQKNKSLFETLEKIGVINGYPCIYLFDSKGKLTKIYDGPRTVEDYLKTLSKSI